MPLLLGTAPNQVPTNGDLGTMAFQDAASVQVGNLSASGNISTGADANIYGVTVGRGGGSAANNTAVGSGALALNTTGVSNTGMGADSLYSNISGGSNTALGFKALTGTTVTGNTAIGYQAGYLITTGAKNTIVGAYTGNNGGLDIRTSSNNIVLSDGDGNPRQVIDGSGNVLIGTTTNTNSSKVVAAGVIESTTTGFRFPDTSTQNTAATGFGFKNRIINGAMVIDQRNAGASVTPINGQYTLDRWQFQLSQASKFTAQQNAGAVTPPVGFKTYLGVTSSSAYSVLTGDYFALDQYIEGFNFADMGWGTASAATVTLSFWVRSSLTGTFGGSLFNSAFNRSYPFSYTISAANTWEQKTVTIAGDTSGTWVGSTNGIGVGVTFGLGVGTTYSGTAGAWTGSGLFSATGATSVVGTSGATFYITGVQLEKGSTATAFDYRPYGTELALCQRYLPAFMMAGIVGAGGVVRTLTMAAVNVPFPVQTRVAPTGITTNTSTAVNYAGIATGGFDYANMAITFSSASNMNSNLLFTNSAASMTIGHGIQANLASIGYVYFNGCEL